MIKEYNYYITTNRFSQIADDLDSAVRSYAKAIDKQNDEAAELREQARKLCSDHLIKSGLRNKSNSFINVDTEFFEGGELVEENLNKFIKNILKAHGYQKILWEYMGTTGLMTEISKSAMESDGYKYENFIPASLREVEFNKKKLRLSRNFNRLNDDSGFDWNKGYDPNYSIEKKGWFSDYDENGVWTRFSTSMENKFSESNINQEKKFIIKLIKTNRGCMLYDPDMILLNPILLWYFTQDNEIYGAEESDTSKMVEEIRVQMTELGVKQITEIAWKKSDSNISEKKENIFEQYKSILAGLIDEKAAILDSTLAERKAEENIYAEKNAVIEKESAALQRKIDAIIKAKPEVRTEEIVSALQSGKIQIPLDILEANEAVTAGFSDEEYDSFIEYAAELSGEKRKDFARACSILSISWNEYKSSGRTKQDCIKLLYEFIKNKKNSDFNYELTLNQIFENHTDNTYSEFKDFIDIKNIESIIKESLPEENQMTAFEYIHSIPEQDNAIKQQVYKGLFLAVKKYLTVRMSTGMSIKELFDYAIKINGGRLPKASFTPPVVGYVNTSSKASDVNNTIGNKRIFFESTTENFYKQLLSRPIPQKEIPLEFLEEKYGQAYNKNKKIVKIGFTSLNYNNSLNTKNDANENNIFYDLGETESINPVLLAILKKIYAPTEESKKKILEIAKTSNSNKEFIDTLKKEFSIEYNLADGDARDIYINENKSISNDFLNEYVQEFAEASEKRIQSAEYTSVNNIQISVPFRQLTTNEIETQDFGTVGSKMPLGTVLMKKKNEPAGMLEKTQPFYVRKFDNNNSENKNNIEEKYNKASSLEEAVFSKEEKKNVKILMNDLNEKTRTEIVHAANDDWNNITPLFIREFLWRQQNGRKTEGLVEEIKNYEHLSDIPKNVLEKFLRSGSVNGKLKSINFDSETLSFNEEIHIRNTTAKDKADSMSFARSLQHDLPTVSVIKLEEQEKEFLRHDWGISTESLSPIIKAYIKSGEWKHSPFRRNDAKFNISSGENVSNSVLINEKKLPKLENKTVPILGMKNRSSYTESSDYSKTENEASLSEELKEAIDNFAAEKGNSSNGKTKLERINENYEHDKAILAKSDPLFAKNQFWDVGEAKENGEMSERNIEKLSEIQSNSLLDTITRIDL